MQMFPVEKIVTNDVHLVLCRILGLYMEMIRRHLQQKREKLLRKFYNSIYSCGLAILACLDNVVLTFLVYEIWLCGVGLVPGFSV